MSIQNAQMALWTVVVPLCLTLAACSGSGLRMRQVPDGGYAQTLNYQFQAQVFEDEAGACKRMVVRVRPLNKVYWRDAPPERLQFFDDDCLSPVRFERAQFVTNEGLIRLTGPQVNQFLGDLVRLEDELIGWLWRQGIAA